MKRISVIFAAAVAFVSLSAASSPPPQPTYSAAGMAAATALMLQSVPPPGTCTGAQYQQHIQHCIQYMCNPNQDPTPCIYNTCIPYANRQCGVS